MFVRSCIACDIDDPDALELRVFTVVFSCCAGGGQGRRCRDQWPAAGRPREAAAGATAFRRPATRRLRTAATGTPLAITHTCCLKAALLLQRPSASFTAHVHVHVHGTECSRPWLLLQISGRFTRPSHCRTVSAPEHTFSPISRRAAQARRCRSAAAVAPTRRGRRRAFCHISSSCWRGSWRSRSACRSTALRRCNRSRCRPHLPINLSWGPNHA